MVHALYGHPDVGGYWEKHCEKGLKLIGFSPLGNCNEWRSCFWNQSTKVLCIVYVDDFKCSGPKAAVERTWKDIEQKSGIGISEPEESTHFLGCKHHVERTEVNGDHMSFVKYDMEKFLSSCCGKYEELARDCGQVVKWDNVTTPHIDEMDWEDLSRRPISDDENGFKCPYCQGIFPERCLMTIPKGQANQRQYASCTLSTESAKNTKLEDKLAEPPKPGEVGKLESIAVRVLMKVFYAARLSRFDLLRAVANLARYITKWNREMDLRLMKLMQYVKSTLSYRQTG